MAQNQINNQTKSKERTREHGEVFTNEREVNAMLDLVKSETERIDSRFLEPACGTGNFLIEILNRKLAVVTAKYKKSQLEWERYSIVAICSCYGVDIQEDNVLECRERLYDFFVSQYTTLYKKTLRQEILLVAQFVLSKNIVCGDALTMKANNGHPIAFCEWSSVNGSKVKRKDFTLHNLLETESYYSAVAANAIENQFDMFSQLKDKGVELITPKAIAEFPMIDFDLLHTMANEEATKNG